NNALLFENTSANPGRNYMLFKTQGTEQGYIGLGSGVSNNMYISAYGASNNIFLVTNNIVRMTILPSGEVGIGTTTPSQKLDVAGNIKITNQGGSVATPDKIDLGTSFSNGATRDQLKIYLYDGGTTQRYGFGIGGSSDIQYHSQVAHDFYVDNSKRFSITGSGGANTSDRRLKREILPLRNYGLQQVMQLNPVTYIFKDDPANTPQVGFIAQEVKQIIPEVVTGKEGDLSKGETLGIVYGNLVPVLTKAIQEQQATIEAQQKTNQEQQAQISDLSLKVEKLTKLIETIQNK
ncbi:MAG: tail fiber domain-containing protein, partial [Bacteroidota bacterium]